MDALCRTSNELIQDDIARILRCVSRNSEKGAPQELGAADINTGDDAAATEPGRATKQTSGMDCAPRLDPRTSLPETESLDGHSPPPSLHPPSPTLPQGAPSTPQFAVSPSAKYSTRLSARHTHAESAPPTPTWPVGATCATAHTAPVAQPSARIWSAASLKRGVFRPHGTLPDCVVRLAPLGRGLSRTLTALCKGAVSVSRWDEAAGRAGGAGPWRVHVALTHSEVADERGRKRRPSHGEDASEAIGGLARTAAGELREVLLVAATLQGSEDGQAMDVCGVDRCTAANQGAAWQRLTIEEYLRDYRAVQLKSGMPLKVVVGERDVRRKLTNASAQMLMLQFGAGLFVYSTGRMQLRKLVVPAAEVAQDLQLPPLHVWSSRST
ncbi:unnamed protein product [Pedinophyceae sp. YPF-701]|nr:unnamed protein product [Pedinophyceae sp. YPF-701]